MQGSDLYLDRNTALAFSGNTRRIQLKVWKHQKNPAKGMETPEYPAKGMETPE